MECVASARLLSLCFAPGLPTRSVSADVVHCDAVNRTGWKAEFTAGTKALENAVQRLRAADDAVHGTRIEAQGAADARGFVDARNAQRAFGTVQWIERDDRPASDCGEPRNALLAARGALIGACHAVGYGLRVVAAVGKAAARALRLRQGVFESVSEMLAEIHREIIALPVARASWWRLRAGCAERRRIGATR